MLDIQKRLTKPFYVLLSLPATAMGFALSVQISALSWILSTKYGLNIEDAPEADDEIFDQAGIRIVQAARV